MLEKHYTKILSLHITVVRIVHSEYTNIHVLYMNENTLNFGRWIVSDELAAAAAAFFPRS